ncbi:MAG: Tol-Pal system beta propeller repeat protein TolB [Nitrosomonadales bacterium]
MLLRYLYWLILFGIALPAHAALDIEITGAGEHQIPISIVPFAGEENLIQSISTIVSADLGRSGLFKLVDPAGKAPHEPRDVVYQDWAGVDALAIGSAEVQPNGRISVKFRLLDAIRQTELTGQAVSARSDQIRAIAHRIADMIFEKLTGDAGVYSTRIVYVNRKGKNNRLVVADSDGYGEQTVWSANVPIISPAWSPDGSHLAYVTFEQDHAVVYVQSLLTNQRVVVANFHGSNSAPAWSPDSRQLAIVLTRDGGSHIYLVRPDGTELHQVSVSAGIDTEPNFSPDGQSLIFASDRGGSVQIYRMPVDGGDAERLTFEGGNNFSPRYSQDGKYFVFSTWNNGQFFIATEDFQSKQMQVLTDGGWEKKPSFAPNGKLILFATEAQGRGILATVSSDGRVKQKMFSETGDIRDPMWGPFLK